MGIKKAVIMAGGAGTRLYPLTKITNKHLLPLYDRPIILYALEKLVSAGIDKIMIITSPGHLDDFVSLLDSEQDLTSKTGEPVQIVYGIQNKPEGIAQGIRIAEAFAGTDSIGLFLGDNIFEDDFTDAIRTFTGGAHIFIKEVPDARRFGVATLDHDRVTEIIEKPDAPKSPYAVTGFYLYDNTVFQKIKNQEKSARGEFEITDVSNAYIREGSLNATVLTGAWFDVGTFDSLLKASNFMQERKLRMS